MAIKYNAFYVNGEKYLTHKTKLNCEEIKSISGIGTNVYQVYLETENGDVPISYNPVEILDKKFYIVPPATW